MFGKRYSCIVIPSEAEGSFWHTGIASYVRQQGRGILLRRKQESAECKEDFSTALEMTVSGGWITHVPYKGYIGKTPLPQRHPERSRGIFLAHRYSAVCVIAENGNASAKGNKKARKRENLFRKEQERAECKEDFSLRSK
mgnify:CR=1 FL=1